MTSKIELASHALKRMHVHSGERRLIGKQRERASTSIDEKRNSTLAWLPHNYNEDERKYSTPDHHRILILTTPRVTNVRPI
jgi:hypothetical protein